MRYVDDLLFYFPAQVVIRVTKTYLPHRYTLLSPQKS